MNPRPDAIKAAREAAGLTQTRAAAVLGFKLRTWQQWEAGDRKMRQVLWDTFNTRIRAGVHKLRNEK